MKRQDRWCCRRPMERAMGDSVFVCHRCGKRTTLVPRCRNCDRQIYRDGPEPMIFDTLASPEPRGYCDTPECQGALLEEIERLDRKEVSLAMVELGLEGLLDDPTALDRLLMLKSRGVEIIRAKAAYL